jgi:hypothetical protein
MAWCCTKKPTDYRSFLGGQEITYPGKIVNPNVDPGNLRLMLTWSPSTDPSIAKYVVYWNNFADSLTVKAASHNPSDTVKCIIGSLSEYVYTFFIYSYDSSGNKSVSTEIDNAHVYGPIYQSGLRNRLPDASNIPIANPDGSASIFFLAPVDTINITTRIKYVNASGNTTFSYLPADSNSITLPSYMTGTRILFQSSYIPQLHAIDTFYTSNYDSIPYVYVMCDKSLFNTVNLPFDMKPYDGSTYLSRIWDGNMQPRGYPTIFHSDGNGTLPETLTFDMGKVYNDLGRIEETGRTCCHNPSDFEIWGIADTTGNVSALSGNNAGWTADVMAKGWTKLGEVIRTDDGIAPYDALLISNPPPVRFIILRVKMTVDQSTYVNISQVTFWNRE